MNPADYKPILRRGPRPLFATVSGAHLYGFESPDSDVDLRGSYVIPLREVLGLETPKETITITEGEVDWVAHDVRKFCQLMTRRNGYVLEQLYSPLVVHGGRWLDELRELGKGCLIRPLYLHYRGFFHNQMRKLATVKDLLYAYRVVLTGIKVLQDGVVECNLQALAEEFGLPRIRELIERKHRGVEHMTLRTGEGDTHLKALHELEESLRVAHEDSDLPAEPTNVPALADYVVRARLELG